MAAVASLFIFFLGLNSNNQYSTETLVGKKISDFELISLEGDKFINKKSDDDDTTKN